MKRIIFLLLGLFLFTNTALAQQADVSTSTPGVADGAGDTQDDTGTSNESFEPDYFTGAATYRITIDVPPGRAGMTPKIVFDYNSHDRDNDHGLGAGWEINESYIQRSLVRGTADYAGNDYILHEGGQNRQLQYVGTQQNNCRLYRFKVEDQNLRYFYKCADHWEVVDKSGKTSIYGGFNAVQSAEHEEQKFRWYLTSIKDLNGNEIVYSYNGHAVSGVSFFSLHRIEYTKNGDLGAAFRVEFNDDNDDRFVYPDYRAGFSSKRPRHISNIIVRESNGTIIKRYDFRYTTDQGVSLLQSVQLTAGEMPNIIALPAKTFRYATFGNQLWSKHIPEWSDPSGGVFGSQQYYSIRDMNGDSLPDRVYVSPLSPTININYNTGSGFAAETQWPDACNAGCRDDINQSLRQTLLDMNGDGLADRVLGGRLTVDGRDYRGFYVRYNDSSRLNWAETWDDPVCADDPNSPKCGALALMDFNGDGLPDRYDRDEVANDFLIYFNRGRGFAPSPVRWHDPFIAPGPNVPLQVQIGFMDLNGDGLPDRVSTRIPSQQNPAPATFMTVFFNKGDGWFADRVQWDFPQAAVDLPNTLIDINSDGLPDFVAADQETGQYHIYLNSGRSFTEFDPIVVNDPVQDANLRARISYEHNQVSIPAFVDLNGDGFLDRVAPTADDQFEVYLTDFSTPNTFAQPLHALAQIDNGMGVTTNLFYTPSNSLQNRFLPFNQFLLSQIVLNEGAEQKVTDIKYYGGQFSTSWSNFFGRKINGYQFVQIADPLGNIEQRWYHQANDVMGWSRLFTIEDALNADGTVRIRNLNDEAPVDGVTIWTDPALSGRMYQRVQYIKKPGVQGWVRLRKDIMRWNKQYQAGGAEGEARRLFVWMGGKSTTDYEGLDVGRSQGSAYDYDFETGNLLRQHELGETTTDQREPERQVNYLGYASFNTVFGEFVSASPTRVTKSEGNLEKNSTGLTYDALLNLTQRDELLNNRGVQSHLITSYAYDAFGNVTQTTDPRGTVTSIAYDAATQTYPATTTIANNFSTTTNFDVRFGKLTSKTTPDGRVDARTYDMLGRVLQTSFEGRWKERFEYIDKQPRGDGARFLSVVKKFTNIASDPLSNNMPRQVSFRDGQGRGVQKSTRSERANTWRIQQTRYLQDRARNEIYTSEPRFAGLLDFVPNPGAQVEVKTTLDSSGRTTEILPPAGDATSPTGPTRFAYGDKNDPWLKISTDAEGKRKIEYFNVWGKIVKVSEFNNGREIITRYTYDFWNNLIQIDANGSFDFVFDNLGRKVSSNDPNTGEKTFAYDEVGNITEQRDANGNRLEWDYDALNRVTVSRSFADQNLRDTVRYTYDAADSADYSVRTGELFMVQDASGFTKFGYDQYGHVNVTSRSITSLNQTLHTYYTNDPDGRVLRTIYPRGNVGVSYAYDPAGQVKELRETARNELLYSINPNADYDQFGHLLRETYGDGTRDEHFYYARSHRLQQNITKVVATNQRYNNKTYSYNRVKNVTYIHDALNPEGQNTSLQNIEYDDLHRITGYETGNQWEPLARTNYSYSNYGNITQNTESFRNNEEYNYRGRDLLRGIGQNQFSIDYDANGNTTRGRGREYIYNARNQLSGVNMNNGWQVSYEYDYAGQRVGKIVQKGNEQNKTYFLGSMFEVRDGQLVHNIFAGNRLIATIARGTVTGPNGPALAVGSVWFGAHPLAPLGVAVVMTLAMFVILSGTKNPVLVPSLSFLHDLSRDLVHAPAVILNEVKDLLVAPHRFYRLATLSFALFIFLPITSHAFEFRPDVDDTWPARTSDYFFYVHTDYLGSSNLLTEGEAKTTHGGFRFVKGELVQRVEYTPFGKERFVLNSALEELPKYTGQTDDIDTDLYYYGSRYYDSVLGRFIQPDSIIADVYSSQALNSYAYVLGNPLRYVDPLGYAASERDNYKESDSLVGDPTDTLAADESQSSGESESGTVAPRVIDDEPLKTPFFDPIDFLSGAIGARLLVKFTATAVGEAGAYEGVKLLSKLLKDSGLSRLERKAVVDSFVEGTIKAETSTGKEAFLRFFGGESRDVGRFLTDSFPSSGTIRSSLALPGENLSTGISQFTIKEGATYFRGTAASNFGQPGGGTQVFVDTVDKLRRIQ